MAVWPTTFKILRDNFKEEIIERSISSNMDVGPAKKRRRSMMKSSRLTFSVILTQDDYEDFKEFYFDNDVSVFDFTRPDSGEVVKCRFNSAPSLTLNEVVWTAGVVLEIMP